MAARSCCPTSVISGCAARSAAMVHTHMTSARVHVYVKSARLKTAASVCAITIDGGLSFFACIRDTRPCRISTLYLVVMRLLVVGLACGGGKKRQHVARNRVICYYLL
jgi:hypothetical protein